MNKNRKHGQKSAHALHHSDPIQPQETIGDKDTGHTVYPELIRQQSRLESLSRTVRNLIPSFSPSSFGNTGASTPTTGRNTYGQYAATPASGDVPDESSQEGDENTIAWSQWASFQNHTFLLVAYRNAGFHIWDVTSLDAVEERLYNPAIGPIIAAAFIPDRNSLPSTLLLLVGSGEEAVLNAYSLQTHVISTRISIPNARGVQANHRFICISVEKDTDSSHEISPGIHILSATPDYPLLYTIPSTSLSSPCTFALSLSRTLAYASVPPPTHRQSQPIPTASYPPSSPFNSSSPSHQSASPLASGLVTGAGIVGSGVLTGAKMLGTGFMEGVKMGMNAAGYRSASGDAGSTEKGGIFSRSAPTSNVSPLSSRGHSRRASGNINARTAVSSSGAAIGGGLSSNEGGSWITVVDLQVLLQASREKNEDSMDSSLRIPRSGSFHSNIPPLRTLSQSTSSTPPTILSEFQYSASPSSTTVVSTSHRTLGRQSPAGTSTPSALTPITRMVGSSGELITSMKWNTHGDMLAIGGSEGGSVKIFKLSRLNEKKRPNRSDDERGEKLKEMKAAGTAMVYELVRGYSPASVECVEWSQNGLWNGLVSRNGTLHIFAVNPQGGPPNSPSHISGRVTNIPLRNQAQSVVRLSAISRLRQPFIPTDDTSTSSTRPQSTSRHGSDTNLPAYDKESSTSATDTITNPSFIFISSAQSLSSKRVPLSRDSASRPITPSDAGQTDQDSGAGIQDVLIFDPSDVSIVLWRCSLRTSATAINSHVSERPTMERNPSIAGDVAMESHLEAVSKGGTTATQVSSVLGGVAKVAGWARHADVVGALTGGSNGLSADGSAVIAVWRLRRDEDWAEVKGSFILKDQRQRPLSSVPSLSHAEITTFPTRSPTVKRPIFLSRQFSFHSLTIDYHALLRRNDLDPPSVPIVVRKDNVIMRGGDGYGHETGSSIPSDFDTHADFLGSNTSHLDLADSPLLGGHLGLLPDNSGFPSSLASTSATSFSSPARGGRRTIRHSFDESLSSALESNLQLDSSYSPTGSSSDIASPGRVMPMLPNGRPGSVGSGVGITGGLEAVVRGTTRVGKDMIAGLASARSPRLMPTKRHSGTPDLSKFDEEEEMFMVDDLDVTEDKSPLVNPPRKEASEATIGPISWATESGSIYPRMTDSGTTIIGPSSRASVDGTDEGTWVAQRDVYNQAVEEDSKFDDVIGVLDEEREERRLLQAKMGQDSVGTSGVIKSKSKKVASGKKKKKGAA